MREWGMGDGLVTKVLVLAESIPQNLKKPGMMIPPELGDREEDP